MNNHRQHGQFPPNMNGIAHFWANYEDAVAYLNDIFAVMLLRNRLEDPIALNAEMNLFNAPDAQTNKQQFKQCKPKCGCMQCFLKKVNKFAEFVRTNSDYIIIDPEDSFDAFTVNATTVSRFESDNDLTDYDLTTSEEWETVTSEESDEIQSGDVIEIPRASTPKSDTEIAFYSKDFELAFPDPKGDYQEFRSVVQKIPNRFRVRGAVGDATVGVISGHFGKKCKCSYCTREKLEDNLAFLENTNELDENCFISTTTHFDYDVSVMAGPSHSLKEANFDQYNRACCNKSEDHTGSSEFIDVEYITPEAYQDAKTPMNNIYGDFEFPSPRAANNNRYALANAPMNNIYGDKLEEDVNESFVDYPQAYQDAKTPMNNIFGDNVQFVEVDVSADDKELVKEIVSMTDYFVDYPEAYQAAKIPMNNIFGDNSELFSDPNDSGYALANVPMNNIYGDNPRRCNRNKAVNEIVKLKEDFVGCYCSKVYQSAKTPMNNIYGDKVEHENFKAPKANDYKLANTPMKNIFGDNPVEFEFVSFNDEVDYCAREPSPNALFRITTRKVFECNNSIKYQEF